MAFINKLFSPRKKSYNKTEASSCLRAFTFSKDQVRLVLFRECDFRGRKLLFDSRSVERMTLDRKGTKCAIGTTVKAEKYVEMSNEYGYLYTKPEMDIGQIGEMVFGAVAMSFRGTSLKIHSLSAPSSLMCTQVFPSPRQNTRTRFSVPSKSPCAFASVGGGGGGEARRRISTHSLDYSLPRLDDSGASSTNSISEHMSVYSSGSDTKLVCRGTNSSVPLDVPNNLSPSVIGDSGLGGDQSYSSVGSCGPPSIPVWELSLPNGSGHAFSCGSLYKRWLRSTSTSLDCSVSPGISLQCSASADECLPRRPNQRSSKLGLAVIIQLGQQEEHLEQFLLEHAALLEAMVRRARSGAEIAYLRQGSFVSLMYEVHQETTRWLDSLLAGPQLRTHFWLSLCDICNSINVKDWRTCSLNGLDCDERTADGGGDWVFVNRVKRTPSVVSLHCDGFEQFGTNRRCSGLQMINFGGLLRNDSTNCCVDGLGSGAANCTKTDVSNLNTRNCSNGYNHNAEKFVRDFCELLELVDVKHTNFFISTLMTAVLTYHLGWVTTVLPPSKDEAESITQMQNQCNPLWGQLSDLYGAIGHPTKVAHTIVSGNSQKGELVTKILNTLTYFIRCSNLGRKCVRRIGVTDENQQVDGICRKACVIPKENGGSGSCGGVEERRNAAPVNGVEIELSTFNTNSKCNDTSTFTTNVDSMAEVAAAAVVVKQKTISRTLSCLNDLHDIGVDVKTTNNLYPNLDAMILGDGPTSNELSPSAINEKVSKLCRVPPSAVMYHRQRGDNLDTMAGIQEAKEKIQGIFPRKVNMEVQKNACSIVNKDVIFVLGENEQLVGLKKSFFTKSSSEESLEVDASPIDDAKIIVSVHSELIELEAEVGGEAAPTTKRDFTRSHSVPPPETKSPANAGGVKKRHSGVKFNFQQYPQIVTNYMKSKNLEISNLPFADKTMKLNRSMSTTFGDCSKFDFSNYEECDSSDEIETLQTPSNASELEFTNDLIVEKIEEQHAKEQQVVLELTTKPQKTFIRNVLPSTVIKEPYDFDSEHPLKPVKLSNNDVGLAAPTTGGGCCFRVIELPMPKSISSVATTQCLPPGYSQSLLRGISDQYISDMVLQGVSQPPYLWESALKRDLTLAARHPLLDQPIQEAVAIVANTDTWEVQLISSHTYVVDRGSSGVRIGMSQLVSNMLESLLNMWRLRTPAEYCLMHIEAKLKELCIRSQALAQLLIATEFCSMELLTSTLQLEVNDVPLLMAVASTHSPKVTQKYGLSFQ